MDFSKIPATIVIETINAERHLEELFDSIQPYFEDIVVIDSYSADKTIDICLKRGVKVVQRRFVTSSDQDNWAFRQLPISTPWLIVMAQDERMTEDLRDQLRKNLVAESPYNGFAVRWRLWFMGQPLHAAPSILRVFRTGKAAVTDVTCNEHYYLTEGDCGTLDGIIEHKDTPTLWDWYEKQNLWTTREAIGIVQGKARLEKPRLLGNKNERRHWFAQKLPDLPFGLGYLIMFVGYYVLYGAWKDGLAGYYWTKCRVWVQWVTFFKVKEIRRTGVIPQMPEPRRGTYDPRVMQSELQQRLLPEVVEEWKKNCER